MYISRTVSAKENVSRMEFSFKIQFAMKSCKSCKNNSLNLNLVWLTPAIYFCRIFICERFSLTKNDLCCYLKLILQYSQQLCDVIQKRTDEPNAVLSSFLEIYYETFIYSIISFISDVITVQRALQIALQMTKLAQREHSCIQSILHNHSYFLNRWQHTLY